MDKAILQDIISEYSGNRKFDAAAQELMQNIKDDANFSNGRFRETVQSLHETVTNPDFEHLSQHHVAKIGEEASTLLQRGAGDVREKIDGSFQNHINKSLSHMALNESNFIKMQLNEGIKVDHTNYSKEGIILPGSRDLHPSEAGLLESSVNIRNTHPKPFSHGGLANKNGLLPDELEDLSKANVNKEIITDINNNPETVSSELLNYKGEKVHPEVVKTTRRIPLEQEKPLLSTDGKPMDATLRQRQELSKNNPVLGPDGKKYDETASYNEPKAPPRENIKFDEEYFEKQKATKQTAVEEAAKPANNIVSWAKGHQRVVGSAEMAAGVGVGLAANNARQAINLELSQKELGGQPITFGDRARQATANVATLAAVGAAVDGASRAATQHGAGYWAQKVAESVKSGNLAR